MPSKTSNTAILAGTELFSMFAAATEWLRRNAEAINAINVFPVPDGDTGTNMYLTMQVAIEEAANVPPTSVDRVMQAIARGALLGARGNSGVILSQFLRGLAAGLAGCETLDGTALACALQSAADQAYRSVSEPVEGTILTVAREVAEAVAGYQGSVIEVLARAAQAASTAVARTPELLPVLREAGVVDSGGQGLFVLLDGALRHLRGEPLAPEVPVTQTIDRHWLAATKAAHEQGEPFGYCTEFLLSGQGLDPTAVRARMESLGKSVLVVGDDELLRVHVHTHDPGAALSYGVSLGSLTKVKVDNMQLQHEELAARLAQPPPESAPLPLATIVICAGRGQADVLRSLGATVVLDSRGRNPSTQELLLAIDRCPSPNIVILPNDKNILLAARQAAEQSNKQVRVVSTTSLPQVVAALLALDPNEELDVNVTAMEAARQTVRTIEVTRAVRSVSIGNVSVHAGDAIALIDGELALGDPDMTACLRAAVTKVAQAGASLATLYYGADVPEDEASRMAAEIRRLLPHLDVEVVWGGQPFYPYIVSIE